MSYKHITHIMAQYCIMIDFYATSKQLLPLKSGAGFTEYQKCEKKT